MNLRYIFRIACLLLFFFGCAGVLDAAYLVFPTENPYLNGDAGVTVEDEEDSVPVLSDLRLETRFDYDYNFYEEDIDASAGFKGKYINLVLNGNISKKFSYSYRQRILPNTGNKTFFDGTDWLYLTYKPTGNFSFSAGKQIFFIGGFEYDTAPINVFYWSDFWNNIRCYQLGVTASYTSSNKKHTLSFQVANSNYNDLNNSNLYGYNLIWYGNFNHFQTIYSVNMTEYAKGDFINYISLGNKVDFGCGYVFVDFMNRATSRQVNFFFDDFSILGQVGVSPCKKLNLFAKGGYDRNKTENVTGGPLPGNCDIFVKPGVEYHYYGVGAEFFPLKKSQDVRLHSFFAVKNAGSNEYHFNIGVTWRIDILKYLKRL